MTNLTYQIKSTLLLVNSEVLGSGGTDLASKYQILAYFEKVLKKLEGTGQLKFYPQCRYNGEGRLTSVLNPELECVVDVTRKVVETIKVLIFASNTLPNISFNLSIEPAMTWSLLFKITGDSWKGENSTGSNSARSRED